MDGPDRPFLDSFKTLIGGIFGTRLTTINARTACCPTPSGFP